MSQPSSQQQTDDLIALHFLSALGGTFKKVPGSNEEAYFSSLRDKLAPFPPDALKAAADTLVLAARNSVWPYVGVCVSACEDAERAQNAVAAEPMPTSGYFWPEEVAIKVLVGADTDLATSACLSGWQGDLVDFLRREKRLPDLEEIEVLVVGTMERNQRIKGQVGAALEVLRGETTRELATLPPNHPIQLMKDTFDRRRVRLAENIANEILRREEVQHVEL
ncbi:hypothetical protein [Pseudovibrio ascidiaceicola]|uniref:hypothetical protein n=1 Tax=Pseudovibrio ascidiaceicola TaxID=285279 RepID=UPI000D69920D|nr:hypothetical protein [Pseudovibrio ascidiaceicola]